jgi:phosphoketolase
MILSFRGRILTKNLIMNMTTNEADLESLFRGYGYAPHFVEGAATEHPHGLSDWSWKWKAPTAPARPARKRQRTSA